MSHSNNFPISRDEQEYRTIVGPGKNEKFERLDHEKQQEFDTLQAKILTLENEKKSLQNQLETALSKEGIAARTVDVQQKLIVQLRKQRDNVEKELEDIRNQNSELVQQNIQYKEIIEIMKRDIDALGHENEELSKKIATLEKSQHEIGVLKETVEKLEKERDQALDHLEQVKMDTKNNAQAWHEKMHHLEKDAQEYNHLKQRYNDSQAECKRYCDQVAKLERIKKESNSEIKKLKTENSDMLEKQEHLKKRCQEVEVDNEKLLLKVHYYEKQIYDMGIEIEQITNSRVRINEEMQNIRSQQNSRVLDLERTNAWLRNQLQEERHKHEQENEANTSRIHLLEREKRIAQEEKETAETKLSQESEYRLREEIENEELQKVIERLQSTGRDLEHRLRCMITEYEKQKEAREIAESKLSQLQSNDPKTIEDLQSTIQNLEMQLSEKTAQLECINREKQIVEKELTNERQIIEDDKLMHTPLPLQNPLTSKIMTLQVTRSIGLTNFPQSLSCHLRSLQRPNAKSAEHLTPYKCDLNPSCTFVVPVTDDVTGLEISINTIDGNALLGHVIIPSSEFSEEEQMEFPLQRKYRGDEVSGEVLVTMHLYNSIDDTDTF